jgi:hypothetical protein
MSENYILIVKNDDHKNIIQGPTDTILAMWMCPQTIWSKFNSMYWKHH